MSVQGNRSVSVIGGGAWGIGLASAAARAGTDVLLVSRRDHADLAVPESIKVTRHMADAAAHARLIVLAVPTSAARPIARELGDHVSGMHYLVHGVRGLVPDDAESGALGTLSDVLREETAARRVGALGGPVLVGDLLASSPSVLVVGSRYPEVREAVTACFGSSTLRVYPTQDTLGLEWASALVGCLTIAVGYAQHCSLGPGLVAALIARSISEAARVCAAAGGDERTLFGLAGYGDLLASISQGERPEVLVGRALAQGKTLSEALELANMRVEAAELIPKIHRWCMEAGVRAPIFQALSEGVLGGKPSAELVAELMTLPVDAAS